MLQTEHDRHQRSSSVLSGASPTPVKTHVLFSLGVTSPRYLKSTLGTLLVQIYAYIKVTGYQHDLKMHPWTPQIIKLSATFLDY